jgi:lysozyme
VSTPRKLGPAGKALIRGDETLQLKAYLPTPYDVPTIGWGHTRGVKIGDTCTREEAEQFFDGDTAEACAAVNALGLPLTQSMFDALVSLVFNEGAALLARDKSVGGPLRRHDWWGAWRGMCLYTKQAGKDLRGLGTRRAQEMGLFMAEPLP